jgi:hypothetical protein
VTDKNDALFWVRLPFGQKTIPYDEVPELIAMAKSPGYACEKSSEHEAVMLALGVCQEEGPLRVAVHAGEVEVLNKSLHRMEPPLIGRLEDTVLTVRALREYVESIHGCLEVEDAPKPQPTTPSPAPVVAVGESGGVEPDKSGLKVGEVSADAPKRETRQAAISPKFSMRLDALIEAHIHEWPTIKTDIKAASDNGLSAAKAGARGWWEELTMEWARANGKLKITKKSADSLVQAMHNMGSLPSRKNRLEG